MGDREPSPEFSNWLDVDDGGCGRDQSSIVYSCVVVVVSIVGAALTVLFCWLG
jgi:hypothetical protein